MGSFRNTVPVCFGPGVDDGIVRKTCHGETRDTRSNKVDDLGRLSVPTVITVLARRAPRRNPETPGPAVTARGEGSVEVVVETSSWTGPERPNSISDPTRPEPPPLPV